MIGPPRIGVIGASGVVGRAAVGALRGLGLTSLRLGSRRPEMIAEIAAADLSGQTEVIRVDADDPLSAERFCDRCDVVLNCAGPSYLILDRIASAALAVGADYVDVAGDESIYAQLATVDLVRVGRTVVLSAGMLPGLSGVIPRWLMGQLPGQATGGRLRAWTGGMERCSHTVATDLVLSLAGCAGEDAGRRTGRAYGESRAAWRDGRRVAGVLRTEDNVDLPFFPQPVTVHPLLTSEAERLAAGTGLSELSWFTVFPGTAQVRAVLGMLSASPPIDATALANAADRVMRAAALDLSGRAPYFLMVFSFEGPAGDQAAVLRTSDSYGLTATVGALASAALLAGDVPAGLHYAADVLDPAALVAGVRQCAPGTALELFDCGATTTAEVGAL